MAVILKMRAIHTTNTTEEKSVGKRWVDLIKIFIESCVISAHGIRSALIVNLNLDSLHVKSLQLRAYAEPTEREERLHFYSVCNTSSICRLATFMQRPGRVSSIDLFRCKKISVRCKVL